MRLHTRLLQATRPVLASLFLPAAFGAGLWIGVYCLVIGSTERMQLAMEALCVAAIGGPVCWLIAVELDLFADELG